MAQPNENERDVYDPSTYDPALHLQAGIEVINLKVKMTRLVEDARLYGIEATEEEVKDCCSELFTAQSVYEGWNETLQLLGH